MNKIYHVVSQFYTGCHCDPVTRHFMQPSSSWGAISGECNVCPVPCYNTATLATRSRAGPRLATISAAPHSDDTKPDMQKCFMMVDIKVSKDPL